MHGSSYCPSVYGSEVSIVVFCHDLIAMKETVQVLENEFSRTRNKEFSIDRLSQMTFVLDNSLFSQKGNF